VCTANYLSGSVLLSLLLYSNIVCSVKNLGMLVTKHNWQSLILATAFEYPYFFGFSAQ